MGSYPVNESSTFLFLMTFPISYLFFFITLISGSILSISSSTWFGAWLGLELNLLSFIPLISVKITSYLSEAAIKYFLVQALASTILIISSSLYMINPDLSYSLILFPLLLKLGAAPFHYWFPQVAEGLIWQQTIILLTIQKLAPIFLISYLTFNLYTNNIILVSRILSALVGALGGLNVIKLRKIIAFSSINHISWILIAISINDLIWIMYFMFYSLISASVIILFQSSNSFTISDLTNKLQKRYSSSILISMNLLSLGGLPPFTGFLPKWLIIQLLIQNGILFPLIPLLFSRLITLYFYLRIIIPIILLTFPSLNINIGKASQFYLNSSLLSFTSFFNLFGILLPLPFL